MRGTPLQLPAPTSGSRLTTLDKCLSNTANLPMTGIAQTTPAVHPANPVLLHRTTTTRSTRCCSSWLAGRKSTIHRVAVSVHVLVAIVKKRLKPSGSLCTLLQILSVTLLEKMPLKQAFPAAEYIPPAGDPRNHLFTIQPDNCVCDILCITDRSS